MTLLLSMMLTSTAVDTLHVSQYITTVSPHVDSVSADRLASSITWWSHQYGLDPFLVAAILRQESNFEPSQQSCIYSAHYQRTFCDYGISQINDIWVKAMKLDRTRLIMDDHYNIGIMTSILARMRDQYKNDAEWYGNYHDSRAKHKSVWLTAVHRWYSLLYTGMEYKCYGYANVLNAQVQNRPRRYYDEYGCIVATAARPAGVSPDRRRAVFILANTEGSASSVQGYGID